MHEAEKSLPDCAGNICANQDSFSVGAGKPVD